MFGMPLSFPALLKFWRRWMVDFAKCFCLYWNNHTLFKSQSMLNCIYSQMTISLLFLEWAVIIYYLLGVEYDENWLKTFFSVFDDIVLRFSLFVWCLWFWFMCHAFLTTSVQKQALSLGGFHRLIFSSFSAPLLIDDTIWFGIYFLEKSLATVQFLLWEALLSLKKLC